MFNQEQFQELLTREHQEKKLNVNRELPSKLLDFNIWFWRNYKQLRPIVIQGEEYTLDTYRFRDSSKEAIAFHKSMMIVDH